MHGLGEAQAAESRGEVSPALSLRSLLPSFVIVGSAREWEVPRARELCAGLQAGDIVLFDRGYHHLKPLWDLTQRECFS